MRGANSFGTKFILTTFGESHGPALGAVVDGCPAGVPWDDVLLRVELDRRRPGSSNIVSGRMEMDLPEVLSGIYAGKTLGTPIAIIVRNRDARSEDYSEIVQSPRSGHADDVWRAKFGHSDPRGGGRSSGRETVARTIGAAVAKMFLREACPKLRIVGFAATIGPYQTRKAEVEELLACPDAYPADRYPARFPGAGDVTTLLLDAKVNGRSYGGIAGIHVEGVPPNLGQPVFHKLKADLAAAFMSVGATSSFEVGAGLGATQEEGSTFHRLPDASRYGGIRGGISTGESLILRVGFKPTSSVLDVAKKGRHDPCIVPRAIPVLEAMTALVLADHLLLVRGDQVEN